MPSGSCLRRASPHYIAEVALCSGRPSPAFFAVFQMVSLQITKAKQVLKIVVGMFYTYVGLVLFLTGVNVGFMPAGTLSGLSDRRRLPYRWVLIPIGMLMGWFIVQAEPAVHVLNKQVEEITTGAIPGRAMSTGLSIGVAMSMGLAMVRVLTGISIFWLLIPGYAMAADAMTLLRAADLHRHCLRLRRRGLRTYDRHLSAAPSPWAPATPSGGNMHHRRLRRGGHGGHDAADHHPDAGPALSVPPEEEWHQRRADRPGG